MTTWLDYREEPLSNIPEIEEYITSGEWTLRCSAVDCKWVECGERTEFFIEEIQEAIAQHQKWHEEGMPK